MLDSTGGSNVLLQRLSSNGSVSGEDKQSLLFGELLLGFLQVC